MTSPKIDTFRQINPMVYSWRTPDVPKYDGWEKIGYTALQTVDDRIAQQASQRHGTPWAASCGRDGFPIKPAHQCS